jgi:hypothetical protein
LPGIKWKFKNVEELAKRTQDHDAAIAKLKRVLDL